MLENGKKVATKNEDHLRYLEFIARLNLWFAKKIDVQEKVKELSTSISGVAYKDSSAIEIISLCLDVLKDLAEVRGNFEKLWLATNKSAGLEFLLMRYDRQTAFWQEKIDQVKRGEYWVDPTIESAWVYHPKANPGKKDSLQVQKAYFRKTFPTPKGIRSATMQLIGDTYAKASVNEKNAGEVYVRRSLSLSLEHQRIKTLNILPLFGDSVNVIAVEAQTFSPGGSAGINIYCELELADGSIQKIMTDSTWKVADTAAEKWVAAAFNDSSWLNAAPKIFPYTVVRPNFATGRSSWMER
jgi:hypothetical protein